MALYSLIVLMCRLESTHSLYVAYFIMTKPHVAIYSDIVSTNLPVAYHLLQK